jgi:hypothetical protein
MSLKDRVHHVLWKLPRPCMDAIMQSRLTFTATVNDPELYGDTFLNVGAMVAEDSR